MINYSSFVMHSHNDYIFVRNTFAMRSHNNYLVLSPQGLRLKISFELLKLRQISVVFIPRFIAS